MPTPSRRELLRATLPVMAVAASAPAWASARHETSLQRCVVTDFGARGDGRTPCAVPFQQAIDTMEAAGGGTVDVPAGTYLLERTPLIGSRVHLRGAGAGTILRGARTGGHQGAALISNKGQQAAGYEGAHDWSISHLAIDSPDTNGIVVTHARRVYLAFIHGIDVHHHFVDIAGREVLCEHLLLTGRSGTSTFQIDSLHGAQTIWDGERAVSPRLDGTEARDVILRSSIITATAGRRGSRPRHDVSIHFHGSESGSMVFSDLILGGATTGFYQDGDTRYDDLLIDNVRSSNPGHAVLLNSGRDDQRDIMIRGLIHAPERPVDDETPYRGLAIHGRDGVILDALHLRGDHYASTDYAVKVAATSHATLSHILASGNAGRGFVLQPSRDEAGGPILVQGCQLRGFDIGCDVLAEGDHPAFIHGNLFTNVTTHYRGPVRRPD